MNSSAKEQAEILRQFSRGIGSVAIPATYTAEVAAALLAGAEALERAVWRPMSEAHEDYGSIVLIDMADPGNHDIAHVCGRDWDEKTQGMTHFAQLPLLTEEIACAALARLEGK